VCIIQDSIAAFEWALRNLYRPGDAIHILHVVPALRDAPASGSLYYPRYDPVGCEQSLWSQAEQFIQDEFVAVAQERGITANIVLVKESKGHDIGQVVCQEAEKLSASPLVMYSHQKSRMEEFFLGSVSKYCATACKRPVLLVHPAQAYGS
jgi:nucleotide-binding universal stress UspA family protein